jgi:NAD(P)-dependent dehydrogenase (short-subunit alcohol dehydrogenase family)
MRLEGKIVLITGAAGYIGSGISERFAREGASLVLNDTTSERLDALALTLQPFGTPVLLVPASTSDENESNQLIDAALDRFGRLDAYVHVALEHANLGERGPFLTMRAEGWDRFLRANLGMLYYGTRKVATVMARQHSGSIVNISSIGAVRAHRELIAYDTLKGAVDSFTRALAVDLAPWGIRVNSIQPGLIASASWGLQPESERLRHESTVPMRRKGEPEDVAGTALFLVSDDSTYVTGQTIAVDGGLIAGARSPQAELRTVAGPENLEV